MNAINKTICELGLRRDIDGLTWDDVGRQAGLAEEGVEDLGEGARSRYRYWIGRYLEEELGFEGASGDHRNPDVKATWTETGNVLSVTYQGDLISSLDEMVAHLIEHGVEMDEWTVSKWECKAYPAWCADRQADLTWENGRITEGTVKQSGGLTIRQVFSVSADFVRKEPVTVRPVLQPVKAPEIPWIVRPALRAALGPKPQTETWLMGGDAHIGFKRKGADRQLVPLHDRRALSLFVQAVAMIQPDGVILGGDWLDLAEWSTKYVRSPHCVETTQPGLIELVYWLRRIDGAMGQRSHEKRKIYLEGNHEVRLRHYLHKHMAHATDLRAVLGVGGVRLDDSRTLSLRRWADLDAMGYEWVEGYPDSGVWLTDTLRVEHGDRALSPGNTAKEQSKQTDANVIFFHVHRRERVSHTVYARGVNREVTALSPGGLMHTDGRLPGASPRDQWQQGFLIVEFERPEGVSVSGLEPVFSTVPVQNGQCLLRGRRLFGTGAGAREWLQKGFPQYQWGP